MRRSYANKGFEQILVSNGAPCRYTGRTEFNFVSMLFFKADSNKIFGTRFGKKTNELEILQ